MADYKTLKGFKVKSLASDPTVDKGQLWYNTASSTLKYDAIGAAAWASIAAVNTARDGAASLGGTPFEGVVLMGGEIPAATDKTETYNGTAWTEVNDMLATRNQVGIAGGTNTAGLIAGGPPTTTDLWNGTCWTSGPTAPGIRNTGWTGATTSDVMGAGGSTPTPPSATSPVNTTVRYNGTSWSAGATMNRAAGYGSDGATAAPGTTALIFGGFVKPAPTPVTTTVETEQYNGTAWTELNDLNTTRYYSSGAGTSTAAMEIGGVQGIPPTPPTFIPTAKVEFWNGTCWTEGAAISAALSNRCSSGSTTACISATGTLPPHTTACEQYETEPATVKTVTTS